MPLVQTFWKPFYLVFLFIKVKVLECLEWMQVCLCYYTRSARFLLQDLALRMQYFLSNPYKVHAHYMRAQGAEEIYTYGETPLTSLHRIMKVAEVHPDDVVYELGSGSGRAVFWLGSVWKCSAVGVEIVPGLVRKAQRVAKQFPSDNIHFIERDFFKIDYTLATVLYLNGTCMNDDEISSLIDICLKLAPKTKIITTSFSLLDYRPNAPFTLLKTLEASFYWGKASVFIQERNESLLAI